MDPKQNMHAYRSLVGALTALQLYAHYHDEGVATGVLTQDLKMASKNLISKIEEKLKPTYKIMGDLNGGQDYTTVLRTMDEMISALVDLPISYWTPAIAAAKYTKEMAIKAEEKAEKESQKQRGEGEE